MVSAWLGICNVSCHTYMNVSNDCHSAKTTGQLPVTNELWKTLLLLFIVLATYLPKNFRVAFPDHSFSFLGTPGQTRAFAALSRGSRGGVHLYRRMDTWAFPPLLRSFRKPFEKFSYIYIIYTIECHSLMAPPTTCFKYKCLQLSPKQMRKQESCQNLPVTFRNIPLSCSFTAVHKQKRHITHL